MNTLFYILKFKWSQFSSVTQSSLTLCDPMDCLSITISWNLLNSRPLSWWCHPTISSSRPLLLLPSVFPSIRVFSNESVLCIRWPKYWNFSFSISPSNVYSGLISFRIDWLDLLEVQGDSQVSSPTPQCTMPDALLQTEHPDKEELKLCGLIEFSLWIQHSNLSKGTEM